MYIYIVIVIVGGTLHIEVMFRISDGDYMYIYIVIVIVGGTLHIEVMFRISDGDYSLELMNSHTNHKIHIYPQTHYKVKLV